MSETICLPLTNPASDREAARAPLLTPLCQAHMGQGQKTSTTASVLCCGTVKEPWSRWDGPTDRLWACCNIACKSQREARQAPSQHCMTCTLTHFPILKVHPCHRAHCWRVRTSRLATDLYQTDRSNNNYLCQTHKPSTPTSSRHIPKHSPLCQSHNQSIPVSAILITQAPCLHQSCI